MIFKRFLQGGLGVAFLLLGLTGAFAQGAIQQSGPVTAGHTTAWVYNGILQDSGFASGYNSNSTPSAGISELLEIVRGSGTPPYASAGSGPLGTNHCDYDAPITNPTGGHYLCFSPNAQGGGLIDYGAFGGAIPLPLQFDINGTFYTLPVSPSTHTGVVIADAVTYAAAASIETYAWDNIAGGVKTLNLYPCNSSTAWNKIAVVDEIGTMGLSGEYGLVVPYGPNTIQTYAVPFYLQFNNSAMGFQCDGLGNWFISPG